MIVLISESLPQRSTAIDGRILRDSALSGLGVRLNSRKRTFLIATSVRGKQLCAAFARQEALHDLALELRFVLFHETRGDSPIRSPHEYGMFMSAVLL